jgi:ABC-type uncharacterized transport system fused permease/ATPase subunit
MYSFFSILPYLNSHSLSPLFDISFVTTSTSVILYLALLFFILSTWSKSLFLARVLVGLQIKSQSLEGKLHL